MATAAILNFFNPPKAATYYSGYCEGLIFFKMAVIAMVTPEMLKN
jgi:hypothetical protein